MKRLNKALAAVAVTSVLALGTAGFAAEKASNSRSATTARSLRGAASDIVKTDTATDSDRPERPGGGIAGEAGRGGPGARQHPPFALNKFWEKEEIVTALALTEDQVANLADSHALTVESLEASKGAIKDAHEALRAVLEVDDPVLADVNAAIDEITAAMNEKMKIVNSHRVVVKTVLTAEQEELLKEYAKENRPERPGRGERPGGGTGPGADDGTDPGAGDGTGPGAADRPDRPERPGDEVRAVIHEFAVLVGPMLEDGVIDDAEQATIDEALVDQPDVAQTVIRKVIERWVQNGSVPEPGERPARPERPERPELPELP
ncbi:MAG: hypothetical protein PWP23_86 [Candidatus Sumerlaeota bacterium]|nr:hypothetical protein [Candidatus Sumerlaeota bacterium]